MTGLWPGSTQCVVNLGFDIDAQSNWIGRNPSFQDRPVLMSIGNYGPKVGTPRILNLLDQYRLQATFFIPGFTAEQHPDLVKRIIEQGHEVAGHGYMHKRPADLTLEEEIEDLDRGLEALEKVAGHKITGYRVPGGESSKHTMTLLAERGLAYDSSLMDDDAPYLIETTKGNLVQLPFHWLLDDFPYYIYAPAADLRGPNCSPKSVARTWIAEFDGLYQEGRCMMLVMHPQVTGHPGHLAGLEQTIKHMLAKPNVAIIKAGDIAMQWQSNNS